MKNNLYILLFALVLSDQFCRYQSADTNQFLKSLYKIEFESIDLLTGRFSPNGQYLALATKSELLYIYVVDDIDMQRLEPVKIIGGVRAMDFSPDSKYLAIESGDSADRNVQILSVKDNFKAILETDNSNYHIASTGSLDYSPDGNYLVSLKEQSDNSDLYIYNVQNDYEIERLLEDIPHTHGIVSFSPDGKYFLKAIKGDGIIVYDYQNDFEYLYTIKITDCDFKSIEYSKNSQQMITGDQNGIYIFSLPYSSGKIEFEGYFTHDKLKISSFQYYKQQPFLIVAYKKDGLFGVYDYSSDDLTLVYGQKQENEETINTIIFSPDQQLMVTMSSSYALVWQTQYVSRDNYEETSDEFGSSFSPKIDSDCGLDCSSKYSYSYQISFYYLFTLTLLSLLI